jgi:8-oxo-dGTP diphosphatase
VLNFVVQDGRILLILKKTGLGKGKINGPGGRIEPGETPQAAAVRELQEELCITPRDLQECGLLHFQFQDGLSLHVTVFRSANFDGLPRETREAVPHWFPLDAIPYGRMWRDDPLWVPHMLAGRYFRGYFLFEEDRMLDHRLELEGLGPQSARGVHA